MKTFIILLMAALAAFPATYYVSSSGGSDANTAAQAQNQATPWQTLAKVNAQTFAAGDNILFKRGDSWEGGITVPSSGSSGSPIAYGAYGTGENPRIKGTVAIAGPWTQYSGNIYRADVSPSVTDINQVFLDNKPLTLARFPNTGYLSITDTLNSTTLSCAQLNTATWTGAALHVRTAHWTLASKRVIASDPGAKTLTLAAAPTYGLKPGWGFFINNKLEALDTAGEWYYDSLARRLYVWTPSGDSASRHTVEGSAYAYGIRLDNRSYVTVRGFTVFGHGSYGVSMSNASRCMVQGNDVLYPEAIGVNINGRANTIDSNTIVGPNTYGVLNYGAGNVLSNNTVRNVALIPRLNKAGMGDQCCSGLGLEIHSDSVRASNNIIDSIGYIGIRSMDAYNVLEYNFIRYSCLSKDDGAGIYAGWQGDRTSPGSAGTVIRNNIVFYTQSAPEGTPDQGYTPGEGIYMDDHGHDIQITGNTTAHCANHGFFLHNNTRIRVAGNVSYNNKEQMGLAEDAIVGSGYTGNNQVRNNVFYSLTENQISMRTTTNYTDTFLAWSDSNYYCNPYNDIVISYNSSAYTLGSWQAAKPLDAHSKVSLVSFQPWTVTDTTGTNLIANGAFASAISQWSFWPSPVQLSWANNAGLDNGCMRVLYTDDSQASSCLVYPSSFRLTAGQAYLLSFSAISNKTGTIQALVRQAHTPWGTLGLSKSFIVTSTRKDFAVVFTASATDTQARVDFSNTKADSLYWLDNVSLLAVTVAAEDPQAKSRLFYNATMQVQQVSLGGVTYRDLDGNPVQGSITLQPFTSRVLVVDPAGAAEDMPGPGTQSLFSAYPNPFNPVVRIRLSAAAITQVDIYDIRGQRVAHLVRAPGAAEFLWNAGTQASGIYFVRFKSGDRTLSRRLTLIR